MIYPLICWMLIGQPATQPATSQASSRPALSLERAMQIVRADEDRRVEVFARAARSVVCIFDNRARSGGGSGVIIDPRGYGLTNFHVVQGFLETRHGYGGLSDGKLYPLRVLGVDAGGDIAMFQLSGREHFDAAPLGDSDQLRVGQWVAAMGNPFLVAEDYFPTITYGVISGLKRYQEGEGNFLEYADCIQVSTSINPGNSGGPLFDLAGRVIGINGRASFEQRGRVNVGLGYAVSVNQIKRFLPGLRAGQFVEHGTLGATVREIDGKLIVDAIETLSAADKAGLQLGDELLSVAGRPLRTPNDYNNIIAILPNGWPVEVEFRHEEQTHSARVRLDRLVLPTRTKYLLDWDHNHAELRAMFARLRGQWWPASAPSGEIVWTGRLTRADGSEIAVRIGPASADATSQPAGAGPADSQPATSESATSVPAELQPTESLAAAQLPGGFAEQWREMMRPLCRDSETDETWEWTGGDEVAGRIAAVIERRPDHGDRVRWLLDYNTAELLAVEFVNADDVVVARWTPAEVSDFGGNQVPAVWTRTAGGQEQRFVITDVRLAGPPSTSASAESHE